MSEGPFCHTLAQLCESILAKKSPENYCDRQTERQSDRQTECKPLIPSDFA